MQNFKDIPLSQLECDPDQPRQDFGTDSDTNVLIQNIQESGIEVPLAVMAVAPDRYIILDGHRRYICAKKLKLPTVPCRIYEKLSPAEVERKRYNIQNNRRPWQPLERSNAIARIKEAAKLKTDTQLAQFLGLSIWVIRSSLSLRKGNLEIIELMEHYKLLQSYREEFQKLRKQLHKVKDFEVAEISEIILKKINSGKIATAKELRMLKKIFNRDSLNENALNEFLSDPDMTVRALTLNTVQDGLSGIVDKLVKKIGEAVKIGREFTPQEMPTLVHLRDLLNKVIE
jgi:ParB/RepB/Spo0J family partition protein